MSTLATTNIKHPSSASNNIVLDSSGNVVLQAGSASTPALQPSGDTNTGIFFPAADTIAFAESGVESARIDSSGRLLVGTSSSPSVGAGADSIFVVQGYKDNSTRQAICSLQRGEAATSISSGEEIGLISFGDNAGNAFAWIQTYADAAAGSGDHPGRLVFSTTADGASSPTERMRIQADGNIMVSGIVYPATDNSVSLGAAGKRWSVVYAATGTINTSDANLKQDIEDLESTELAVAQSIKSMIKKFRFKDAVEAKGDEARIHVGIIAQEVEQAFVDAGLDPRRYALFCEDDLEDGTKRLGIRYDELLAFVLAAL